MNKYNLNTLNLRDLQEAIERGEYPSFPVKEWMDEYEKNPVNDSALVICPYDGTIYQTPGNCPSPFHPYPKPRTSNRIFRWLIFIPAIIAFTYSVINNETLVNLIVTTLLLVITALVFTLLLGGVIYVWAKISPESVVKGVQLASHFVALLSGFFAMIIVSTIQGQFPPLIWWVIEFVVAFTLENYVTNLVARFVFRKFFPEKEFPEPDDSLEMLVQECANRNAPGIRYRLLFFVSSLSVGLWFYTPALYHGKLPPIWMIPIILAPYIVWLWKFSERFSTLMQCPILVTLIREDKDNSLKTDLLTTSALAILKPTTVERTKHWWQMVLFYISMGLPPAGLIATIVLLGV